MRITESNDPWVPMQREEGAKYVTSMLSVSSSLLTWLVLQANLDLNRTFYEFPFDKGLLTQAAHVVIYQSAFILKGLMGYLPFLRKIAYDIGDEIPLRIDSHFQYIIN